MSSSILFFLDSVVRPSRLETARDDREQFVKAADASRREELRRSALQEIRNFEDCDADADDDDDDEKVRSELYAPSFFPDPIRILSIKAKNHKTDLPPAATPRDLLTSSVTSRPDLTRPALNVVPRSGCP